MMALKNCYLKPINRFRLLTCHPKCYFSPSISTRSFRVRMRKPISAYSNRRWLLQGLYLILVAAIFTSALGVLVYRWVNPGITMLMVNKHYNALKEGRYETIKKNWVRIENISPNMLLAAVSAGTCKFTEHWGFDFESIRKAVASNKRSKRVKGASTISQQTAKNVFLWPTRSWVRKGFEPTLPCWWKPSGPRNA
jgi:membrane peptidoglycan carboxypeptidase